MIRLPTRIAALVLVAAPSVLSTGCHGCCPPPACCASAATPTAAATPMAVAPTPPRQVLIEIEVLRFATPATATRVGGATDVASFTYGVLAKPQSDELATLLAKDSSVEILALPSVVSLLGEEASIFVDDDNVASSSKANDVDSRSGRRGTLATATVSRSNATDGLIVDFSISIHATTPMPADLALGHANRRIKLALRSGETAILGAPSTIGSTRSMAVRVRPTLLSAKP